MKFSEIIKKMIKYNIGKYRILFACNFGITVIFFCFAMLLTDTRFMNERIVDPMISSNIYFPGILMAVFMAVFLPFSYGVYLDSRKRDYGILITLGMSRTGAFSNLVIEGTAVSLMALIAALSIGTIVSTCFYSVLHYVLRIEELYWSFHMSAYIMTGKLYLAVIAFTIIIQGLKMVKQRIAKMLHSSSGAEKRGRLYTFFKKKFPVYMNNNLIRHSFLMRNRGDWRFRMLTGGLIIAVMLFLICFSISLMPSFYKDAEVYEPFDMAYAEIWGKNSIPNKEIMECLKVNKVPVKSNLQISFVRDSVFNYVSAMQVNEKLGCNYDIKEGEFLNLFQYEMEDGYEHDVTPAEYITIKTEPAERKLISRGSDIRILWNLTPGMADRTLILNDKDFRILQSSDEYYEGKLNLFQFYEWKKSKNGVIAVQELLRDLNKQSKSEQWEVRISSKVQDYERAYQSGNFLVFLITFVVFLLYKAEYILIYFRIMAEREENKRNLYSLYLLGVSAEELNRYVLFKNRVRFMLPVLIGTIAAIFPVYICTSKLYDGGKQSVLLCLSFGVIFSLIICFKQIKYSKKEIESFLYIG